MSTSRNPASPDPAAPVATMLQSVDALGSHTGRLFGRLYGGLRRKSHDRALAQEQARRQARERIAYFTALAREQSTDIARLTGVLAVISEGVIMQDTEGRIVLMNQAARDLLGSVRNFWDSDLGRMFAEARHQTALDGEVTLGPARRVEVNDRIIGAQMAIVADPQQQRLGTVLMLRDVTQDTLAERLKDEFITQMSHELRTPLASIKGMSEVLLALPADQPPKRRFLEAISRNAALLDRMIVQLLDLSEIGTGSFAVHHEEVNLPALLTTVIKGLDADIRKAGLSISLLVIRRSRQIITGDNRRLQWAVSHLIDTAIKYTEPGGEIVVTVGRTDGPLTLIEVSDTGVGIRSEDLPHIFERFYRGQARTRSGKIIDPRGLGQGLFVARAVAEAHGGYLSVASVVGAGSTFTLAIHPDPAHAPERPLPEMPAAPQRDPGSRLVEPPIDPTAATLPSPSTRARKRRSDTDD